RPSCLRNSRKAWAVVAKPPGTRTPVWLSCEIISPRLAFLPPTTSTSLILRCSNGTTRAAGSKRDSDMGKLRDVVKPALPGRGARARALHFWILVGEERAASGVWSSWRRFYG